MIKPFVLNHFIKVSILKPRILEHKDITLGQKREKNFEFQKQKLLKTTILNYILILKLHF